MPPWTQETVGVIDNAVGVLANQRDEERPAGAPVALVERALVAGDSIEEVARKQYNFRISKNVLRIMNKEGESIPFRLNAGQRWVHSQFENN